jgi:hypothetical protein
MAPEETVIEQTAGEIQKMWRAAAQVGAFLARLRQRALAAAERSTARQTRAMREAMEAERRLAEPFYARALDPAWWEHATPGDGAEAYGHATRWASMDPQAALAVRACEKEALDRWGIDLAQPLDARATPTVEDARRHAPILPGEQVSDHDLDAALADAASAHRKEHLEADEALADSHGQSTPRVRAEVGDDLRAEAEWDTLEARKAWEDRVEGQVHDHAAVRAVVTADKGLSSPVSTATTPIAGARAKAHRPKQAAAVARTHSRSL